MKRSRWIIEPDIGPELPLERCFDLLEHLFFFVRDLAADAVVLSLQNGVDNAAKAEPAPVTGPQAKRPRGRPRKTATSVRTVTVGLYRPGSGAVH